MEASCGTRPMPGQSSIIHRHGKARRSLGQVLGAAALLACAAPVASAQVYVSTEVGAVLSAAIDGVDSQEDVNYRLGLGYDTEAWRWEGSAASQATGISFHTIDAYSFGVALYRDVELGDGWTVYTGGGVDYYNVHGATDWPLPPAYGDGWGWRVGAGVSHPLSESLTGFANVTYQRAYLDFDEPVPYQDWEIYNFGLGLRWAP